MPHHPTLLQRLLPLFLFFCFLLPALSAREVRVHDPVVAREGDNYYLFSTGPGIPFFKSKDLKHWSRAGRVFESSPSWTKEVAPGFDGNVWAPDIVKRGDRFYLFYAISAPGKITSAIGLTINKTLDPASPDYSWKDQGIVIRSIEHRDLWNAIDPQVLVDEKGTAWMSFGSFWGGLKMVKLNESWTAPAEPPEWHSLAKRERSVLVDDGDPEPAALEGPFVFRKGPWYYLFISWDYCCRGTKSTYKMVVGRARDFRGPYLDREGKKLVKGGGTVLLAGNPAWPGVGHNSAYTFDGKDYLVFHAYDAADHGIPKLKIGEINWDAEGWPVVDPGILDHYHSVLEEAGMLKAEG
jgi:arabinan endo-1,5-alpha-L-arabinosidase